MTHNFQNLRVYQESIELTKLVYQLTKKLPQEERYILIDQLIRAVNSIGANIAEGFGRYHKKECIKFLYNTRGSLAEVLHHLIVARELRYISKEEFDGFDQKITDLGVRLNNLINSIKRTIE